MRRMRPSAISTPVCVEFVRARIDRVRVGLRHADQGLLRLVSGFGGRQRALAQQRDRRNDVREDHPVTQGDDRAFDQAVGIEVGILDGVKIVCANGISQAISLMMKRENGGIALFYTNGERRRKRRIRSISASSVTQRESDTMRLAERR